MNSYYVNFKRLLLLLLPTFWRKPLFGALGYALMQPLGFLHTRLLQFRSDSDYRLSHNGQVCHLRAVLNDAFDPLERGITISGAGEDTPILMLYTRAEEKGKLLPGRQAESAMVVNRRGFGGVNAFDFTVNVPARLNTDGDRMRAIVNIYKLASKRFSINYI